MLAPDHCLYATVTGTSKVQYNAHTSHSEKSVALDSVFGGYSCTVLKDLQKMISAFTELLPESDYQIVKILKLEHDFE